VAKNPKSANNLIWLDLEMSGLEPDRHVILEIGCAITTSDLELVAEGPTIAVYQPPAELAKMDAWCVKQHGKSGLTRRVMESKISLAQAERETLQFVRKYCLPGSSPLCGNSIGQDRRFLYRFMPKLNDFFHYRNIDVSTIKELVKRWYPASFQAPVKKNTHCVMEDIRESIAELKHYRDRVFRQLTT
jgi:oligoribonuclease